MTRDGEIDNESYINLYYHDLGTLSGDVCTWDEDGIQIDGYIDLKIKTKAKTCKCDKCNTIHLVEDATYQIPKKGGHRVSKGDK